MKQILSETIQVRCLPEMKSRLESRADSLGLRMADLARIALAEAANGREITIPGEVQSEQTTSDG